MSSPFPSPPSTAAGASLLASGRHPWGSGVDRRAPCRKLVLCLRAAGCPFRESAPRPERGSPQPAAVPRPGGRTAGTAVSPTRPLTGKDTRIKVNPGLCTGSPGACTGSCVQEPGDPSSPPRCHTGDRRRPRDKARPFPASPEGSWSGPLPLSSTPIPAPDCPGHPPNRHPRVGTVPGPLPPRGG